MKDEIEIQQALINKLINKPNEYYDNHQALSIDLFTCTEYKLIFDWIEYISYLVNIHMIHYVF